MRRTLGALLVSSLASPLFGIAPLLAADDSGVAAPAKRRAHSLRLLEPRPSTSGARLRAAAGGTAVRPAAIGLHEYEPIAIEPPAGKTRSRAQGVNNLGQVAGRSFNYDQANQTGIDLAAFIWDPVECARALPGLSGESSAWGLNNNGQASGWAKNADGLSRAVRWDTAARPMAVQDLGTLVNPTTGQPGPTSEAYEIGEPGDVVGDSDIPNGDMSFIPFHAFRYSDGGGLLDLGTFDTSYPDYQYGYSIGYGVNAGGQVVGLAQYTATGSWLFRPFIYDTLGGLRQLPIDPVYEANEWYGVAINGAGLIGGHVIAATDRSLPHYWTSETASPVAVTMPAAYPYGEIYGINAQGVMVGIMWNDAQEERAFAFDLTNGVRDLNDLVDPALGWSLTFARDINDAGQIVGGGMLNGQERGFLLSPWALAGRVEGSALRTGTAEAVAGATVRVYTAAGGPAAQAVTDAAGRYALALVPGTYFAVAANPLGGADQLFSGRRCAACDPTTGDPIVVAAGVATGSVSFSLDSPPAASINDATVTEGDSGQKTMTFTITLSKPSDAPVGVDFGTAP